MTPDLSQLDRVKLLSTKRVTYLSAKPGEELNPHGVWTVIGFIDDQALLSKESMVIKIPIGDVLKCESVDVKSIINQLSRVKYGQERKRKID